jgi:gamma-glutamyltranspeptidase
VSPDTAQLLRQRGHTVEITNGGVARVEGILVQDGWLQGGSDSGARQSGKAAGY